MKNKMKKLTLLLSVALAAVLTATPVLAESKEINGSCYFNGTKIVSDYTSQEIADAVTNLQPGDDVSFTVTYTNSYKETTDWYMENRILQTLEKASASKRVSGTGKAENGAYTYELIHYNKNGVPEVLFSNREVGGEAVVGGMEGLEQATNALDEWFYIQTLKQGETGRVVLKVAFDGETEVNDYMDTDGGLAVRFAVELNKTSGTNEAKKVGLTAVKTGDPTNTPLMIGALVAGIVLLIVALRLRKKEKDNTNGTGGES